MLLELPNGARQKRINLAEFEDESSNLSRSNSKATGIYSSIDYPTTTNEDIDVLLLPNFHFLLHDFFLISCFQFPSCSFDFALKNQSLHYTNLNKGSKSKSIKSCYIFLRRLHLSSIAKYAIAKAWESIGISYPPWD